MENDEGMLRRAYCEGLLDGRDKSTTGWKYHDILSGKETPLSLWKVMQKSASSTEGKGEGKP